MSKLPLILLLLATALQAQNVPPAQEILSSAREQVSRQALEVQGQLRQGGTIVPFRLTQNGPVIRYGFSNPEETLQLRLGESDSTLELTTSRGSEAIAGAEFTRKVRGTAVTYEDLALKFIYWPNAKVVGDDYINTRRVWKLELQPPARQSQYSRVFIWCEQQSGALMRMEGFDGAGRVAKRFEVVSVQKIEGRLFLKQMRIEELQPDTGKVRTRTYLEVKR